MTEVEDEEELEADACPSQAAPRDLQVQYPSSAQVIGHTDTYHQEGYIVPSTRSALRTSSEIQYLPSFEFALTVKAALYYRPTKPHRGHLPSQNKSE
jgi:hypothetical protein